MWLRLMKLGSLRSAASAAMLRMPYAMAFQADLTALSTLLFDSGFFRRSLRRWVLRPSPVARRCRSSAAHRGTHPTARERRTIAGKRVLSRIRRTVEKTPAATSEAAKSGCRGARMVGHRAHGKPRDFCATHSRPQTSYRHRD